MTESVKSVNVLVKLYFKGNDVSRERIDEALANMEYSFIYDDFYLKIIDTEIIDTFVPDNTSGGSM